MQTVQLQCGSCSNMMAISVEHLGAQVQCPHCAAVVQTPPRSALGPPPGPDPQGAAVRPAPPPPQYEAPAPGIQVPEQESIFSDPEPSDDLFGGDHTPKIHMPEAARAPQRAAESVAVMEEPEEEEEQADLTAMRSRLTQERKAGSIAPTLLVFLVPYALFTTAFVAYLLYMWPKLEAFEWLPDPKKPTGKALNLPVHDRQPNLKASLKETVRVGQMEITPLKVLLKPSGDMVLEFKAKNLSTNVIKPLDGSFFDEARNAGASSARPFTFIEKVGGKKSDRIYGGKLEFLKGDNQVAIHDDSWAGLQPGQECIVHLDTSGASEPMRDRSDPRQNVQSLLKNDGPYLWRLQFRRGSASVWGVDTPLTAVIGIEFGKSDIVMPAT